MSGSISLDLAFPSTVTREKIPTKNIQSWNFPKELNDNSTDEDEDAENPFGVDEATAGPSNPYNLRLWSRDCNKDEDTISISSDSSTLLP